MAQPKDDPLARLQQAANKLALEEAGQRQMDVASSKLILGRNSTHAFFASLMFKLEKVQDWSIETACTNGKVLKYNPGWVAGLTVQEAKGLLCHEIMHCALQHMTRREHRDNKRWNVAGDLVINPMLKAAGFSLPGAGSFPGEGKFAKFPMDESTEGYYDLLPEEPPQEGEDGDGQADGQPDPGGCGGVEDAGDGSDAAQTQSDAEWKVAVEQAHEQAKGRGALPGGLERLVQAVLNPKVDWKDVLREFVSKQARNDYSWSPPNKRFIHIGLYLPGLRSEELGDVVCAVDTSGSIGEEELTRFASELQGVLEVFPDASLTIVYHDSTVQHVQTWEAADGPLCLQARGGGGTDHRPVFEWCRGQPVEPTCMICLTDLASCFPDVAPPYPVLWATVGAPGRQGPFGRTVEIDT